MDAFAPGLSSIPLLLLSIPLLAVTTVIAVLVIAGSSDEFPHVWKLRLTGKPIGWSSDCESFFTTVPDPVAGVRPDAVHRLTTRTGDWSQTITLPQDSAIRSQNSTIFSVDELPDGRLVIVGDKVVWLGRPDDWLAIPKLTEEEERGIRTSDHPEIRPLGTSFSPIDVVASDRTVVLIGSQLLTLSLPDSPNRVLHYLGPVSLLRIDSKTGRRTFWTTPTDARAIGTFDNGETVWIQPMTGSDTPKPSQPKGPAERWEWNGDQWRLRETKTVTNNALFWSGTMTYEVETVTVGPNPRLSFRVQPFDADSEPVEVWSQPLSRASAGPPPWPVVDPKTGWGYFPWSGRSRLGPLSMRRLGETLVRFPVDPLAGVPATSRPQAVDRASFGLGGRSSDRPRRRLDFPGSVPTAAFFCCPVSGERHG